VGRVRMGKKRAKRKWAGGGGEREIKDRKED
jgi:hypothetical protein